MIAMKTKPSIQLKSAEIILLEKGIVKVVTTPDYETSVLDVDEINEAKKQITGGGDYFLLVITSQGASSSAEAKEYAAKESFRKNILGQAIVIKNLALRMAATVYMTVNRPKQKIKLFNSEESALNWIRKEKSKL